MVAAKKTIKKDVRREAQAPKPEKRSAKAVGRYLRISPRKMRLVINTIRYQPAPKAFSILMTLNRKAARLIEKLLKSAVANAKDLGLDEGSLYISDVRADGGPLMKRFRPRSMGRADQILKRTTHLSMIVTEGEKKWASSSADEGAEGEKKLPKTKTKKIAVGKKQKSKVAK